VSLFRFLIKAILELNQWFLPGFMPIYFNTHILGCVRVRFLSCPELWSTERAL
jgi:hypothetical protein